MTDRDGSCFYYYYLGKRAILVDQGYHLQLVYVFDICAILFAATIQFCQLMKGQCSCAFQSFFFFLHLMTEHPD